LLYFVPSILAIPFPLRRHKRPTPPGRTDKKYGATPPEKVTAAGSHVRREGGVLTISEPPEVAVAAAEEKVPIGVPMTDDTLTSADTKDANELARDTAEG